MPAYSLESLATVGAACAAIAAISFKRRMLDGPGVAAAVVIGLIIGVLGHPAWLLVLLVYMVSSFGATKVRFDKKLAMGVAEGKRGERTWRNVLANGSPAAAIAALTGLAPWLFPEGTAGFVFLTAIAVAASDTLASEIGVLSPRTVLITHPLKSVPPGTDGGVSLLGHAAALAAATYVAVVGYVAFILLAPSTALARPEWMALPIAFGFLGCQIDSLVGASLERRGWVSKGGVNYVSITISASLAWATFWFIA